MDFDGDLVPWYLSSYSPRNVVIGKYGEGKAFETKTPLKSWSHATVVFSEGGGTLYLDGKELTTQRNGQVTPSELQQQVNQ